MSIFKMKKYRNRKNTNQLVFFLLCLCSSLVICALGYSIYREVTVHSITYSISKPVFEITLNNQSATTAGTTKIYVKYGTGYYLNSNLTNQMSTSANGITKPTKNGVLFRGYYTGTNGSGVQYIDANGKLTSSASTTNFSSNGTLYAYYITVKAENLSYDNTNTGVSCSDAQCMIDYIANMLK